MKKFIGFIAIAGLLAFSSCSKDRITNDEEEKKDNVEFESMDDFYNQNAVEEQSFRIDSLGGDTIYGKDGTKIWGLSKTKFMTKSTHKDIFYPYTLKLIECYSLKNMIFSRLPNVAQGKILKSGGELKITAFKDGVELVLKENKSIPLWMPATGTPDNGMELFYGFTKGTTNDWNNDVLNTDYIFQRLDSTSSSLNSFKDGYLLSDLKLGWINCDRFYDYPNKTDISFTFMVDSVEATVDLKVVDLMIIFKNLHSFMMVTSNPKENMPIGEPITVFAMARATSGKMYYFKEDFIITAGMIVDVNLTLTTEAELKAMLDTL
jgi:hypothetical protein